MATIEYWSHLQGRFYNEKYGRYYTNSSQETQQFMVEQVLLIIASDLPSLEHAKSIIDKRKPSIRSVRY